MFWDWNMNEWAIALGVCINAIIAIATVHRWIIAPRIEKEEEILRTVCDPLILELKGCYDEGLELEECARFNKIQKEAALHTEKLLDEFKRWRKRLLTWYTPRYLLVFIF